MARSRNEARLRRKTRIRKRISGTAETPRLAVFRSGKHIYIQAVDDIAGRTLATANSLMGEFKETGKKGSSREGAEAVGKILGQRLIDAGISTAVFDRGGYLYHGRVKAVAEGAREAGLKF